MSNVCKRVAPLRTAMDQVKAESAFEGRERGFWICQDSKGALHQGASFGGTRGSISEAEMKPEAACPEPLERVGMFHTHPIECTEMSGPDLSFAIYKDLDFVCISGNKGASCHQMKHPPVRENIRKGIMTFSELESDLKNRIAENPEERAKHTKDLAKLVTFKTHFDQMVLGKASVLHETCELPTPQWEEPYGSLVDSFFKRPLLQVYPELQELHTTPTKDK